MTDSTPTKRAVLFDRDGTLVVDVPYNGDPSKVELMPGARTAVWLLRQAGFALGVVSNQSGIARGLITAHDVEAVNARVDALVGPLDTWRYCPHGEHDGCACRKPRPGLVLRAAVDLGVDPRNAIVIGDIAADLGAAKAAGASAILVPTGQTLRAEVDAAPVVAATLLDAVWLVLSKSVDAVAHASGRAPVAAESVGR
jgi:histidinol-phosphate phosphatase family protein